MVLSTLGERFRNPASKGEYPTALTNGALTYPGILFALRMSIA